MIGSSGVVRHCDTRRLRLPRSGWMRSGSALVQHTARSPARANRGVRALEAQG